MKREDAADLAHELMTEFGLIEKGWRFGWMNRKRTLGLCRYSTMQILLSRGYVDLNNERNVEQTIRHEIAHALAGNGAGHGPLWVSMAYQCGVTDPKAICQDDDLVMEKGRYQATCATCGFVYSMHKRGKNIDRKYCHKCYVRAGGVGNWEEFQLTFVDTQRKNVPVTSLRAPVSASQTSRVSSVSATSQTVLDKRTGTVTHVGAPELAAAMGIDGKTLRGWLRRNGGSVFQVEGGKYQFTEADVRYLVLRWNESH